MNNTKSFNSNIKTALCSQCTCFHSITNFIVTTDIIAIFDINKVCLALGNSLRDEINHAVSKFIIFLASNILPFSLETRRLSSFFI